MNVSLEPRKVERPFIGRWLRTSLDLIVRSPVQFGLVIVLLVCLDNAVVQLASGYRIEKLWTYSFGSLLLGFVWVFVAALARGADDAARTWSALAQFVRPKVWAGAVASAAVAVGFELIVDWLLGGVTGLHHRNSAAFLRHPGDFAEAIAHDAIFFTVFFTPFYFPLLALIPDISPLRAQSLSISAARKNGNIEILLGVGIIVVPAAALSEVAPVFGLVDAVTVLFLGVFNYVAYRDVFERRPGNAPQLAGVKKAPGLLPAPADRTG